MSDQVADMLDDAAELVAQTRRQALCEAAAELRHRAVDLFSERGPHDPRAAALWDAGCHIDPDDKNALGGAAPITLPDPGRREDKVKPSPPWRKDKVKP
jgi:hypothetical protein